MRDAADQFREAMRAAGLQPPDRIEPGALHRFPGIGKSNGNRAGWCKLFEDCRGGCFGDWAADLTEHWQAKRDRPLATQDREAFLRQVAATRAEAEAERRAQQEAAATRAREIWDGAARAPDDHPYLARKGIWGHGVRLHEGALVVPLHDANEHHSLQFIGEDGEKRFLSGGRVTGCWCMLGTPDGAAALCVAEGFATGATIHEATGHPVAVAFNAGNLAAVARAMRELNPAARLILCADDDAGTEGNPGLRKAREAAREVGGLLAVPEFGGERPDGATDFNDMAAARGLEAVRKCIEKAGKPAESEGDKMNPPAKWPEPQPLSAKVEPEPYPLDVLPETVRRAVEEVQGFVKAPVPLVASSALAALSLAIQAQYDAKRAERLTGPASLFLLTIADSGERKSTCDGYFTQAVREYQETQGEAAKPVRREYRAAEEAWEAKRNGIKDKLRQFAKAGKATEDMEKLLRELEQAKPEPPRVPRLLYMDATPEALAYSLSTQWPSGGVVSAEAGAVFGAHGMGKDSVMRNLALLNMLWDGGSLTIDRRTAESFVVRGARLTVALQVQEATLGSFFDRSEGLARGTGFLARFLVAWPESTQGERWFSEPPAEWPALEAFNRRIAAILAQPVPMDEEGTLNPPAIPMNPEAKAAWVSFHNAVEGELAGGGSLYDVRDVASKAADNVARLAVLLHVFEGGGGAVGVNSIEAAGRIVGWHLNEARRFFGELALPEDLVNMVRLDGWLVNYCRQQKVNVVARRDVQRNVTPTRLRQKAALDEALRELVEAGRVMLVDVGRRKEIHVNPALLEGGAT